MTNQEIFIAAHNQAKANRKQFETYRAAFTSALVNIYAQVNDMRKTVYTTDAINTVTQGLYNAVVNTRKDAGYTVKYQDENFNIRVDIKESDKELGSFEYQNFNPQKMTNEIVPEIEKMLLRFTSELLKDIERRSKQEKQAAKMKRAKAQAQGLQMCLFGGSIQ